MKQMDVLVNHGVDNKTLGNECRNTLLMTFFVLLMVFINHERQTHF